MIKILENKPKKPNFHFIFAHGAGAPMDSEWMNELASYLCSRNIHVYRNDLVL